MKEKEPLGGYVHQCPMCGKTFWAFADWAYQKNQPYTRERIYYCSWHCKRKREKEIEEEKAQKRLDKLETALFFQEQRIKELEAKIEPKGNRIDPHLDTPNKIDAWSIAKMDIEEAVKKLKREGYTDGVTFWLPVVGMCGPMPIRKAVEYIHMHVRPIE